MGENNSFKTTLAQSEKSLKDFSDNAIKIGKSLSLAITTPFLLIGTAAVKSASDIETLQASFEVLLGSGSKAKQLLGDLKQFAGVTPFETKDLADSAKILLQFGINGDKILPTLKQIGDISLGSSEKMKSIALVFGQITSTGRLMGQDLLQLIGNGFNPLNEISKKTGESMAALKDRMADGRISADEVAAAFKSATEKGGLFFEGTKKLGETFAGKLSTLKDDATTLAMSFADILMPVLKDLVASLSNAVAWFNNLDHPTKEMILQLGLVAASIGPVILVIGELGKALTLLTANPIVLAIAGISALAIGINYLNKRHERDIELLDKKTKLVLDNRDATNALLGPIIAEGTNRKLTGEEIDKLIKIYPNLNKAIDRNNLSAQDAAKLADLQARAGAQIAVMLYNRIIAEEQLAVALEKRKKIEFESSRGSTGFSKAVLDQNEVAIKQSEKKIALSESIIKGQQNEKMALLDIVAGTDKYVSVVDKSTDSITANAQATKDSGKEQEKFFDSMAADEETQTQNIDGWNGRYEAIQANIELQKKLAEESKETKKDIKDETKNISEFFSTVNGLYSSFSKTVSDFFSFQKAELDAWYTHELEVRGLATDNTIANLEKERDTALAAGDSVKAADLAQKIEKAKLDEEFSKKKKKILHDEAIFQKALAITDIIIKTTQAVVSALAIPPLAVTYAILGAAQLAIAASQPIPELAEGGIVPATAGGRTIRVAEAGQAEAIIPLNRAGQFGLGGRDQPMHLVVNLDSKPFLDMIFPASRNRTILIDQGAIV